MAGTGPSGVTRYRGRAVIGHRLLITQGVAFSASL